VAIVDAIEVVDLDEVRVDEARRDARLLLEQLDVLGREQSLVDLLDRDALAEPRFAENDGGEDLGHAPDVDPVEEMIAPESSGKGFFHRRMNVPRGRTRDRWQQQLQCARWRCR
jgi:hypothetical protein